MVVDESPLKTFFRPDEVELLVSGCQVFIIITIIIILKSSKSNNPLKVAKVVNP